MEQYFKDQLTQEALEKMVTVSIQRAPPDQRDLQAENDELKRQLESVSEDAVYFRDLIHSLYCTHINAASELRAVGDHNRSEYHHANAVAYKASLNHFDNIRKLRG